MHSIDQIEVELVNSMDLECKIERRIIRLNIRNVSFSSIFCGAPLEWHTQHKHITKLELALIKSTYS